MLAHKPRIVLFGSFVSLLTVRFAAGQCTPFFPPTECPVPAPMTCPDDGLGDFCDADGWFVGPGGLSGVIRSGDQVQLDQNCDGDVADPVDLTFDLPADIQDLLDVCPQCALEMRLSPSQDFLYAKVLNTTTTVPGCGAGQVRVFFFGLGTPPTLVPFSGLSQGSCLNAIAIEPRFYDRPGDPVRTAVLVAGASGGRQPVMWADLAGMAVNLDTFNYVQGVQIPQFSQRGNAALLRSVSGGFATNYALIDLCRSPVGASGAVSTGPFPPSTTITSAEITGSTGSLIAVITHNSGDIDIPLADCLCGACCNGGSCSDDESDTSCAGTFVPGEFCAPNPCGSPLQACCLPGGVCTHETAADCAAQGGTSQPGMTCQMVSCTVPTEACCFPNGACSDLEPDVCAASGGTPDGPGSTCATTACPPPPGTEACCLPSGGCLNLPPVGPFPSCAALSGTAQGAGANCLSGSFSCPTTTLTITKTGPASVQQGQELTYTIIYGNAGPNDSAGVQVRETLPAGTTFVSASDTPSGAAPTFATGAVTWPVGALAAGVAGQQVSVTLRAGCNVPGNQIVNNSYQISGSPGGTVAGAPVTTTVTTASQAPISIAVSSVDLDGAPLRQGDLIEHTITLVNSAAEQRDGLTVGGQFGGDMTAGCNSFFDAEVDAAGGTFVVGPSLTHFRWRGGLGPGATATIVFTTRLNPCVTAGLARESLNCRQPIGVSSSCGQSLGTVTPADEFDLARPVAADLVALNVASTTSFGQRVIAARAGTLLEFEVSLTEQYNEDHAALTASLVIPAGITPDPAADPLVNPPAGASYDPTLRRITYSGPLTAGQTLAIRWNGILEGAAPCRTFLDLTGSVAACSNISVRLAVLKVPLLPQGRHIIGLDELGDQQGLWLMELGAAPTVKELLCLGGELFTGMDRAPDGELWFVDVVGTIVRFNPQTDPPQLESFGMDVTFNELALASLNDVAFDPTSAERSVILVGEGGVRRFYPNRSPGQRGEVIVDDPALPEPMRVSVDAEGMIAAMSSQALVRIDPTGALPVGPNDYAQFNFTVPGDLGGLLGTRSQSPHNLALDTDGDYLVMVTTAFLEDFGNPSALPLRFTLVQSLLKIDRTSGTVGAPGGIPTTLVERLSGTVNCFGSCPPSPPPPDVSDAMFPGVDLNFALAADVDSNGSAYIGSSRLPNRAFVVHRDGGVTGESIIAAGPGLFTAADFVVVDSADVQIAGDLDGDGDVDADDFALFEDAFGTSPGDSGYNPAADMDGDGDIDCDDWRLFLERWAPPLAPFFRPCVRRIPPGPIAPTAAREHYGEYSRGSDDFCGSGVATVLLIAPLALVGHKSTRRSGHQGMGASSSRSTGPC